MAEPLSGVGPLLPIIERRPFGLLSDVDGTLAPIVPVPEDARVPVSIRGLLGQLISKGVRVALITGRSLEMAQRIVGVEGVAYAADHGLTLLVEGRKETAPGLGEYESLAKEAERDLMSVRQIDPGIELENKGALLAVHYRRASKPLAREAVLEAIERSRAAEKFQVQEGRMVIELRPPLAAHKGTALKALVERLGLRGAICLGDDITDIDMFAALGELRSQGLAAASIAVASAEAAPEVASMADYRLEGVEGVERLLEEMAETISQEGAAEEG